MFMQDPSSQSTIHARSIITIYNPSRQKGKCTTPGHRCLNISTRTREQSRLSRQDKTGIVQLNLGAIDLQFCSTMREARADKSAISHESHAIHRRGAEPRRGCSCDMFWHVLSSLMHF
eukprot:4944078-Prymnesium_polylepis.1